MKKRTTTILLLTICLVLLTLQAFPVSASTISAYDIVGVVNAMRAQRGFSPLVINGALTAAAQAQSDYQASIKKMTHSGSGGSQPEDRTRAAGYSVNPHGGWITENVAGGANLSASAIVSQWTDNLHMLPMTTKDMHDVGVGVATADGFTYITLVAAVVPGSGITNQQSSTTVAQGSSQTGVDTPVPTFFPIGSIQTSTPRPDGSIAHTVLEGQFLSNIAQAYGIGMSTLIAMNNLAPTPFLYAGDRLVMRPSSTITPTPRESATRPPTNTREPTITRTITPTEEPTMTRTITPSVTPTVKQLLPPIPALANGRSSLAIGMIVVCALGLTAVIVSTIVGRKK